MNFIVRKLESVGSTNMFLQQILSKEKAKEGVIVWAKEQCKGRGHGHNQWESKAGKNLTFSLLLKPFFITPENQFLLTQLISLAIVDLIKETLPKENITIKWPNDIYIGNKKVAGILIQNFIKGQIIDYSIAGIGLNVNQKHFLSDAPNPVSLIHFTQKPLVLSEVLDKLLMHIKKVYKQSASTVYREEINKRYLSHLFRYRKVATFKEKGLQFQATIMGIGKFGQLILQLENGTERLYSFKEVEFVI
jgi:BirA family biotin operon repressor/biotin-[acetyl-CoA-carboxylase] ligase